MNLITNLKTVLTITVFIGFVAFGGFTIMAEHRYYILHVEGKFKHSKVVYWLAVLLTVAALLVVYRIFFLRIYPPQFRANPTAYV